MPHRSHKRWHPSIKAGTIGQGYPAVTPPTTGVSEQADDDKGRPSRYCNPNGFVGLHGNRVGKNTWEKRQGMREVKRRTQKSPTAVQGEPFDA